MSSQEYYLVAGGWFLLLLLLGIFWYATLRRLSDVLKENLKTTRGREPITGFPALFRFIMRGEFEQTGDKRLMALCRRLRQLLYGYLGVIGAYFVFLVLMHPRY
jgi:hypothetical protein